MARGIVAFFAEYDLLLTPALAERPLTIGDCDGLGENPMADLARSGVFTPFTSLFNVTGQPAITVPIGFGEDNLPTCVQIVGKPLGEDTLLQIAAQIETARPWAHQRPPENSYAQASSPRPQGATSGASGGLVSVSTSTHPSAFAAHPPSRRCVSPSRARLSAEHRPSGWAARRAPPSRQAPPAASIGTASISASSQVANVVGPASTSPARQAAAQGGERDGHQSGGGGPRRAARARRPRGA